MKVAVGFLIAYDYQLLQHSLPLVYVHADKIVLAIDHRRKTFAGKDFEWDESFKDWVLQLDTGKKISWVEEPFFREGLTPQQVVLAKRNRMLACMQPADWYLQLDADEYFLDFSGFVKFLQQLPPTPAIQVVQCYWKTMFRQVRGDFLMVGGKAETVPIAINIPENTSERFHREASIIQAPHFVLHQSWARSSQEIKKKVGNWSHSRDFDTAQFFRKWQRVNAWNYRLYRYFHPMHPPLWPYLEKVKSKSIPALIHHYQQHPPQELPVPALSLLQKIMKRLLGL